MKDLTTDEVRAELERTRPAYDEHIRWVAEHPLPHGETPEMAMPEDARRHLDAQEELDRRPSE